MSDRELFPRTRVLDHGRDPTRARPEPWFVGNGRGLMIGVLALVGALLLVRAVSMLWLAERAWTWVTAPGATDVRSVSGGAPPAPPPPGLHDWIGAGDYPAAARPARAEGVVDIAWDVARDGRIARCTVLRSSGNAILDATTCRLLRERGRYAPVRVEGAQRFRRFSGAYRWRLPPVAGDAVAVPAMGMADEASWIGPDDYPVESARRNEQGTVRIDWTIGADGRARDCQAVETSGHPRLDKAACAAIVSRARYRPARDEAGRAVATSKSRRVTWRLPD